MRTKKKFSKRMLALLLSAVMIAEPASTSMIVHATEADDALTAPETVSEETENAEAGENAENSGSNENENKEENGESNSDSQENDGNVSEGQDNTGDSSADQKGEEGENDSDQSSAENQDPDDQNSDDQNPDEENPEEQTPDEEEGEDVEDDENVLDEEKEEENQNSARLLSMPSDYKLTSEQKNMKSALSASMGNFDDSAEGVKYVERQVFAFADNREEAETIAEAYHAELIEYDEGVAVLKLEEDTTVGETLRVAASADNNLPAVYPDYYRYAYGEEREQDNSAIEVTEEEYELEENTFNASESEEISLTAYEQVLDTIGDPNMEYNSEYYQWQHVNVGSVYAWNEGYLGQDVTVAVLDTGVSGNDDIVPVKNFNMSEETESGYNDRNGHGTHVAGIIAAALNDRGGAGIAPRAQIVNIKVLNDNGSGYDSQIIQGIYAAISERVDIMNLSLGGIGYSPAYQLAIDDAYKSGIAMFVAAGNDGGSNMCYPAACDHVICVAAVDNNNQRASFSNYGAWVDLSAPGVNIWSTGNRYSTDEKVDNAPASMSGTSQATPVAAGEAAVILSSGLLDGKSGKDKVDALENLMKTNAVSVGSGMGKGVTSLTKVFGLSAAAAKPAAPVFGEPKVSDDEQSVSITIKAQAGTQIYYTDNGKAPSFRNGAAGAGTIPASNPVTLTYTSKDALNKITISAIAVNESGVASAVKKVTATIKPWVTDIEISGVSRIAKGKSTQLTAEVVPSYAANKAVAWSIDGDPANISVNAKGKVTTKPGVEAKEYTIRVTAKDRQGKPDEFSKTYSVTVMEDPDYIKSVKFKTSKGTVSVGDQPVPYNVVTEGEFMPEAKPDYSGNVSAADFVWSSSNKTLATVDASGNVTAKAPGSVKITATANDGSNKKAVFTLTIKQLATSVAIAGDDMVAAGASITLKADVKPDKTSNKKVEWISSDPENVPVKNGVVKPKAGVSGEFTITAKALEGTDQAFDTKVIYVKKGKITGISFSDKSAKTIFRTNGKTNAAKSVTFTATISGTEDCALNAYTCTSSNPGIAKVEATGDNGTVTITVTATEKAAGKTTITLMATDGSKKKATCNVNVCNPVSKILIAPTSGNGSYVAQKKSLQLKATLESEYGTVANKKVKWELYTTNNYPTEGAEAKLVDAAMARSLGVSISASGKVSAKQNAIPGILSVKVTAADGSGAEAWYKIRVTQPVKRVFLIGSYTTGVHEVNPKAITVLDKLSPGEDPYAFIFDWEGPDSLYGGIAVSSSNPKVASVTYQTVKLTDGSRVILVLVSADNPGSTVITVKALDGSGAQVKYKMQVR